MGLTRALAENGTLFGPILANANDCGTWEREFNRGAAGRSEVLLALGLALCRLPSRTSDDCHLECALLRGGDYHFGLRGRMSSVRRSPSAGPLLFASFAALLFAFSGSAAGACHSLDGGSWRKLAPLGLGARQETGVAALGGRNYVLCGFTCDPPIVSCLVTS